VLFGFFSGEYIIVHLLFDLPGGALNVAVRVIVATALIIFFFFVLRVLLLVLNKVIAYYRKKLEAKEETHIYSRALLILEFIFKYILIISFALLMVVSLLAAFGFEDIILTRVTDFFLTKFGFIIMLGLLVIIAISIQRFSHSFFEDLKKRPGTKTISPGLMFIIEKSIKVGMYLVLVILAIFTILSAMGLGELGQTIILMMSVIIGFVVSMAATGSIGNALSGLVLYGFKPVEKGDRVTMQLSSGDMFTGDVENIDLMFTSFRDLEGQIVKVPNNIVMGHKLVNHTKSEKPGFAVVVDVTIGYDVPAEKVKDLMRTSAIETAGVLKDPKPFVLLTKFHNHAIEYRLRAYIDNAKAMYPIRSAVMRHMQKNFAMHGIEILSPLYHVKREEPKPSREDISRVFTAVEQADRNQDEFSIDQGASAAFEGLAVMEALDHVADDSTKKVEKKKKETA
jgi:small-conductance mechanosensitive channel